MTCQHDATYRIENEANGGAGCPICRRERKVASEPMSAEQLSQLADMADDIEESPKDWADMRGDTAL